MPAAVRESLAEDYAQVQAMLDKLEHGHIHIAVFGRVSVGKSATLNALLGEQRFSISPLHGETKQTQMGAWDEYEANGVYLIDTPGMDQRPSTRSFTIRISCFSLKITARTSIFGVRYPLFSGVML